LFKKKVKIMSKYKDRFSKEYQNRVGQWPKFDMLTNNSKELAEFLDKNNIITDGINIFEIGAAGCRNLKYINDINNNINLFANDLYEDASRKNMHESLKEKINFTEMDTLSLFQADKNLILDENKIDVLLSSDHLMHIDKESVIEILGHINSKWKPTYICMRELINKEGEDISRTWPRVYHDHDKYLLENYELVAQQTCAVNPTWYGLRLYKLK